MKEPMQTSEGSSVRPPVEFSGFWRRVGAFAIDALLLGIVGAGLGFLAPDWLVSIGQWGRLIGFAIAGIYLVVANSRVTGGQTIGKRLLGLRVQSPSGELIRPGRSVTRYLVFGFPYFANGVTIDVGYAPGWAQYLSGAAFGGVLLIGLLGSLYLLIFNRPSRRVLHDLLAGTVVVRQSSGTNSIIATLADYHWAAVVSIPGLVVLGILVLAGRDSMREVHFPALARAQTALSGMDGVIAAGVSDMRSVSNGHKVHVLVITADVYRWPISPKGTAASLVQVAAAEYGRARDMDAIQVRLRRGFDIGIAGVWRTEWLSESPASWLSEASAMGAFSSDRQRSAFEERVFAPQTLNDVEVMRQVQSALSMGVRKRDAVDEYIKAHGSDPGDEALRTEASLRPMASPDASVAIGSGGAVDVTLKGGALDGRSFSWVPIGHGDVVKWVCAKGNVPPKYFGPDCK